jgi:CheY-like chemotaxis protein
MLRLRGHSVTTAGDGIEAVEAARTTLFDLILMDISMPRMDGLEATRTIRRDPVSRSVPVIGVTANASPDKVPEFLAAGLNDVLVKPVTRNVLMSTIAAHVRGAKPSGMTLRARDKGECPILNAEVFAETMEEMGRDFVERLAARLLSEVKGVIVQLRDLTAAGALTDAARAAHKTAGAAAAIGLAGLQDTLAAFEACALEGDAQTAATALDEVRRLLPLTVVTLRHRGLSVAHDTA